MFKRNFCFLSLLTCVFVVRAAAAPAPAYHVKGQGLFPVVDGDRQAVIVGYSHYLRRVVEACTGVTLRQVPETTYVSKGGEYPIYIGQTMKAQERLAREIGELDVEGYIILVEPTYAILYGGPPQTDTGDPRLWVEGDFCRRFMGADHYLPGPLGVVFPKQEQVVVPCGLWVENPAFRHRHWSGYSGAAHSATWRLRASGGGGRFQYHHNLYKIISPEKYKDRPDLFPVIYTDAANKPSSALYDDLQPGQRYVPTDHPAAYWQPCTTHPEVLRLVVEAALAAMAQNPANPTFSLGINDSAGFCVCPSCVKATPEGVDPYSRAASAHRFYSFYNKVAAQVAESRPDASLGFLVYSHLGSAYPAEKLHPLLMPYKTLSFADAWDPVYKQALYKELKVWSNTAARFGIYEYYFGMGFLIPRIYLHAMADGLREVHKLGGEGFYAEAYANWGLDGPKLWVTEKLLWNPDQDVNVLIDQWCTGLFGEAAAPMRAYFDYVEDVWVAQKPAGTARGMYRLMGSQYKKEQFTELFSPAVCDTAWALLEKAEARASQEIVQRRVAYYKESFAVTRLASKRYNAATRLDAMAETERQSSREAGTQSRPLVDWLVELEGWAAYPELGATMNALRTNAPYAFHEFSQEAVRNQTRETDKVHESFAAWDTDVNALRAIVEMIVQEALKRNPRSKIELDTAVSAILEEAATRARGDGRSVHNAIAVLRPLCATLAIQARTLPNAPVIDGVIEAGTWGAPQFDGTFYRYPTMAMPMEETTTFWCGTFDNKLYVAFHCRQAPKTIRNTLPGRDDVPLKENRGREYIDLGRSFVYLTGVDSVGVSLPDHCIAMVTAAGGIFDGQGTPYGITTDWNGCTAKVARVDDGWCVEMVIELGEKSFLSREPAGIHHLNFFRSGGGETPHGSRSAWVPATPTRWSINPGTKGLVFFDKQEAP